ncbi:uncharacterized protein I206_105933 [Kwoniella pini CBS 10737]|uniref:Uncharacterized protein n=1 Tax=Kwoniella pini CBS 10737 TaxID=1296096 RepID=A0A1B9I0K6_9TREE|nr:uncharacterized protein I206_04756 [Kwoniella pini CBS 10737]OCF49069.1 hypothetical protein I206_04756 [Kwoniella pini CBS 10737]
MEILIDDTSPQISYYSSSSTGWITNHSNGTRYSDGFLNRYSQSTFHATFTEGDRMEFRFNGSGIKVFGANRDNHATYSVELDGLGPIYMSGHTDNPQFQAELFRADDLPIDREHRLTMTNRPNSTADQSMKWWFDVDHIITSQPISDDIYTTLINDTSPYVTYDQGWKATGVDGSHNFDSTRHVSTIPSSTLTMSFNGSSVQIFGTIDSDHGNYSISLDGIVDGMYSATNWQQLHDVSLFIASGLNDGPHVLELTNLGKSNITTIDFGYAVVNSTIKTDGYGYTSPVNATHSGTSTGSNDNPKSSSNSGAIAGLVVAVILVTIALGLAGYYVYRKKRQRQRRTTHSYSPTTDQTRFKEIQNRLINILPVPRKSTERKQDWARLSDPPQTATTSTSFDATEPSSTRTSTSRRDTVIPSLVSFRASFSSLFDLSFRSSNLPMIEPNIPDSNRGSKSIVSKFLSIISRESNQIPIKISDQTPNRSSYQSHPFKASTLTPRISHHSNTMNPITSRYAHTSQNLFDNHHNTPPYQSNLVEDMTTEAERSNSTLTSPMFSEFFNKDERNNNQSNFNNKISKFSHIQRNQNQNSNLNRARISVAIPMRHLSVPYTATMVDFDSSRYTMTATTTRTSIFSNRRDTCISEEEEIDLGLFSIPEFAPPAYAQATRISLGPGKIEQLKRIDSSASKDSDSS